MTANEYMKSIKDNLNSVEQNLEQIQCDDCISRQAAIEAFQMFRRYESNRNHKDWVDTIEMVLNQLPPVNPQPKTGHWIEHPETEYLMFYECSECGDKQCFCKSDIHRKHFCNYCGAKMVAQESEE